MSYIRSIKQGEDLYEVVFDGGSKKTGLTLMEAVTLVEEELDKNRKNPQIEKSSGDGSGSDPGMDLGITLRSQTR